MPKRKRYATPILSSDPPEHEHYTPKRQKVFDYDEEGKSRGQIRELTGIPERSQTRILSEGVVRRSKKEKYSGRPRKLDDGTIQKMIKSLEGHYKQRVESWDDLALQFGYDEEERPNAPPLSARTVKRYLNQAGYHKCRAC